jgi:hypothetical protein
MIEHLSAEERLALMLAANARGDAAEVRRIVARSPAADCRLPDLYPLGAAWLPLAYGRLVRVLDLVVTAVAAQGLANNAHATPAVRTNAARDAKVFRRLIRVEVRAWVLFGRERGMDALGLWRDQPGYATVRWQVKLARKDGLTAKAARALARAAFPGLPPPRSVNAVLAALRADFQGYLDVW